MPDFPSQNMPFQIYAFFPPAAEKPLKVKLAVARFNQDHEGPAFCTGSTASVAGNYCGASHKQCLKLQSPDGMRCATVTHTVPCLYAGPADFLCRRVVNLCLSPVLGKARRSAFWERAGLQRRLQKPKHTCRWPARCVCLVHQTKVMVDSGRIPSFII